MSIAPYVARAQLANARLIAAGYKARYRHYPPTDEANYLDRHYVTVTVDDVDYSAQWNEAIPVSRGFASNQSPGFDPEVAARLDRISGAGVHTSI